MGAGLGFGVRSESSRVLGALHNVPEETPKWKGNVLVWEAKQTVVKNRSLPWVERGPWECVYNRTSVIDDPRGPVSTGIGGPGRSSPDTAGRRSDRTPW